MASLIKVYGAWLYPELEKKGWNTVLNKGEIYNNCTSKSIGTNGRDSVVDMFMIMHSVRL